MDKANILVLGLGNILCCDEGVGVHIAKQLDERYALPETVEVLDGGTAGMELLEPVAGRDCLIVTDAISSEGKAPGTVLKIADDEVQALFQTRFSPHQIGLSDVLASLQLSDEAPERIVIIGVVPESLELGLELTPVVAAGSETALQELVSELRSMDLEVNEKAAE
jgi:hydrogenase maturation protease